MPELTMKEKARAKYSMILKKVRAAVLPFGKTWEIQCPYCIIYWGVVGCPGCPLSKAIKKECALMSEGEHAACIKYEAYSDICQLHWFDVVLDTNLILSKDGTEVMIQDKDEKEVVIAILERLLHYIEKT